MLRRVAVSRGDDRRRSDWEQKCLHCSNVPNSETTDTEKLSLRQRSLNDTNVIVAVERATAGAPVAFIVIHPPLLLRY